MIKTAISSTIYYVNRLQYKEMIGRGKNREMEVEFQIKETGSKNFNFLTKTSHM